MSDTSHFHANSEIPIVPYLKLPLLPGQEAVLTGCKCTKCGEVYFGKRAICLKCSEMDSMEDITLSRTGEIYTYTIVNQSAPWVKVPYIAAVVKLPEGPFIAATLTGCEAVHDSIKIGMPVKLVTEKVRQDNEGHPVIAFKFEPI